MIGIYNFKDIKRGDTFDGITLTLKSDPDTPIDLSNYTIRCMFRIKPKFPVVITLLMFNPLLTPEEIELEESQGVFRVITLSDPTNGKFTIGSFRVNPLKFSYENTLYMHDIEFDDGVNTKTMIEGTWLIKTDITR